MQHPEQSPIILIVEDNPEMGQLLRMTLEMEGYGTSLVTTGAAALEAVHGSTPELIIMDISLGQEPDGLEVARQLQNHSSTADIPIFFVTARADMDDVVIGLELGVDYLTKPFAVLEFSARVQCILRQQRRWKVRMGQST
jgi:two-component system OmpR family response regulator